MPDRNQRWKLIAAALLVLVVAVLLLARLRHTPQGPRLEGNPQVPPRPPEAVRMEKALDKLLKAQDASSENPRVAPSK